MNRLNEAQSPYLLRLIHHPVDWRPWSEGAFRDAARLDRPIFLSIGYATCQACEAMEEESLTHPTIAGLVNAGFVAIKVDREEHPEVARYFMTLCQRRTRQLGWPLTVLLTPDGCPFFVATYMPRTGRYGGMGLFEVLPRVLDDWANDRKKIVAAAAEHVRLLEDEAAADHAGGSLALDSIDIAFDELRLSFDAHHGGFREIPRFPAPYRLLFLLRFWHASNDPLALDMVRHTLLSMRMGALFDHVGFGYHRYTTDRSWKTPRHEKMLYDQAGIALACIEMRQATGEALYGRMVEEVLEYVSGRLQSPEGGFFTSEDAGQDGAFYRWTIGSLYEALGPNLGAWYARVYGMAAGEETPQEHLPALDRSIEAIALEKGIPPDVLEEMLEDARVALLAARERRPQPGLDDKILTDWNALAIVAFARAGSVMDRPDYLDAARRALTFLQNHLYRPDGGLYHRYHAGRGGVEAGLDDYATLVWAFIETYEACFEVDHLEEALRLADRMMNDFWDETRGGFFNAPAGSLGLRVRLKDAVDGETPSGTAMAMYVMLRLGHLTGNKTWIDRADAAGRSCSRQVYQHPSSFPFLLCAVDFAIGPVHRLILVGDPASEDTRALIRTVHSRYLPNRALLLRPPGEAGERLARLAPIVRNLSAPNGNAAVYVCEQHNRPTAITRPEALDAWLRESGMV